MKILGALFVIFLVISLLDGAVTDNGRLQVQGEDSLHDEACEPMSLEEQLVWQPRTGCAMFCTGRVRVNGRCEVGCVCNGKVAPAAKL